MATIEIELTRTTATVYADGLQLGVELLRPRLRRWSKDRFPQKADLALWDNHPGGYWQHRYLYLPIASVTVGRWKDTRSKAAA